jgi:hypothetical protein
MAMAPEKMNPAENSLFTLQPAWSSYFVFYAAVLIFGLGPMINPEVELNQSAGLSIAILLLFFVVFRRKTTYYRLTKEEIIQETTFAGRVFSKSLPLENVSGLEVRRGVIHRLLGIGHIQFRSQGGAHSDLWWYGIADPFAIKKRLEQVLRENR